MLGVHIEGNKEISKKSNVKVIDKVSKVYIPLVCGNDTDLSIMVSINDKVYKGQEVACRKGLLELPIHSSVSGKVIGFEEKMCYKGTKVNTIVIENDEKETVDNNIVHDLKDYTKEDFLNVLKNCGIRGLGGADFPTYIKYKTKEKIKNLIVNGVECEPYITADYYMMKNHISEILESIDAVMKINNIDNAYIAIKKYNKDIINSFNNKIGSYPNIKVVSVPDQYPMGWEKNLVKYIIHKNYNKLTMEVNTIVNNVSTMYAIYNALKKNEAITHRIITISGEMIKKPINVDVKIGTSLKDVIDDLGIKKGSVLFVAGGPMMGVNIPSDDLVVSSNLNCILVLNKTSDCISSICLRCGKCVKVCPAKLSPVLIKDNVDDNEKINFLEANRCIECGLCSYVCPAKINVREFVRKAKENMRGK